MSSMRSLVDQTKMVYPDQWVLSLVAKPKGKNPEHAIILVEGLLDNGHQFVYRRYDFVTPDRETSLLKAGTGLVITKNEPKSMTSYLPDARARYFWTFIMNDRDMANPEGCQGASWIITPEEAEQLSAAVLADQAKPPHYLLPGNNALLPKSSSQSGHNCYTWARQKILDLKTNQNIQHDDRLKLDFLDFAAGARTTRHLKPLVEATEAEAQPSTCRLM